MNLDNILRCGYTFTSKEYELETKYIMTTAFLMIVGTFLSIITGIFYMIGDETATFLHAIGASLSISSIFLARLVSKNDYHKLVYFMMMMFTLLIMYSYYLLGDLYPISAWIIIQILASFLVLETIVAIVITCIYFIFFFFLSMPFTVHTFSFIALKIIPVFVGLVLVYFIERKFTRVICSLEDSNKLLEKRVLNRTKEIEIEKERLYHQAHFDFLTDLPNRNKFHQEIQTWIKHHAKEQKHFSIFFIDLDRFKRVNDSLGHNVGDKVLQIVASRVKELIPKDAFFARISGDEFTLLLIHDNLDKVRNMAKTLIKIIEKPISLEENKLYISASIGISCYPEHSVYYADLIKYADTSMFEAKKVGRGTYKFYAEEMTHKVEEIVLMEAEIHSALDNEELVLFYQPQVDIRTNTVMGIEVLVRWRHPTLGLFFPDSFIPLAEDTGVIIILDYYVLRKGMKQIVSWKNQGLDIPRISFNFSTKHLQQKGFVSVLKDLLEETNCRGEWIELEITESHIMSNIEEAIAILDEIRKLSITIAIDDFGIGYSSLGYLKLLPADKLKIDKSFISKLLENSVDMTISKAIIDIGNSIGLTVIAEGVETEEQQEFLRHNGCYYVQGFLYYEAMSVTELEQKVLNK